MKQLVKHAGGRPTKYKPSVIDEVDKYLETTGKENMHLPKIQSLALWLKVNTDTLYEWASKHPEFSDALKKIMQRQAEQLIDDGIYGGKEINSPIVKLLLENNHGMRQPTEVTILPQKTIDDSIKDAEQFINGTIVAEENETLD